VQGRVRRRRPLADRLVIDPVGAVIGPCSPEQEAAGADIAPLATATARSATTRTGACARTPLQMWARRRGSAPTKRGPSGQLRQQQRARVGHRAGAVGAGLDPERTAETMHLRSAFPCGPVVCSSVRFSRTGKAFLSVYSDVSL
jgi:hypothetical protein